MTFENTWLRWSGSLFAALAAWVLCGSLCLSAPYLPVTGPVPLREAAPRPACVLSVNPPLVLEGFNSRHRAAPELPAMTNSAASDHSPASVAVEAAAIPVEPPFEYESVITHAGGPTPSEPPLAEPPVAANPPSSPATPESVAPPPLTPQMLMPMLLTRPREEGRRGDPAMIMPVNFQPPEPTSSGRSSTKYQSK